MILENLPFYYYNFNSNNNSNNNNNNNKDSNIIIKIVTSFTPHLCDFVMITALNKFINKYINC